MVRWINHRLRKDVEPESDTDNISFLPGRRSTCRGGFVAAHSQRHLLEAAQYYIDEGPDCDTFCSTATIDRSSMTFWVKFAFVLLLSVWLDIILIQLLRSRFHLPLAQIQVYIHHTN